MRHGVRAGDGRTLRQDAQAERRGHQGGRNGIRGSILPQRTLPAGTLKGLPHPGCPETTGTGRRTGLVEASRGIEADPQEHVLPETSDQVVRRVDQELQRAAGKPALVPAGEPGEPLLGRLGDRMRQHCLAGEVEVEGAVAHSRAGADHGQGREREALPVEDLGGRLDQCLTRAQRAVLLSHPGPPLLRMRGVRPSSRSRAP